MPEISSTMALGDAAMPPRGFVQLCLRQPVDCTDGSRTVVAEQVLPEGSSTAVSAISIDLAADAVALPPATADLIDARPTAALVAAVAIDRDAAPTLERAIVTDAAYTPAAPAVEVVRRSRPATQAQLSLDSHAWMLLTRTNDAINRAIIQRKDIDIYGVDEMWATPLEDGGRYGDCEDYVLEKRRALIAAGVPAKALSIAVARTGQGDIHAVLLVATDKGDYVLDNLSAWVLPWAKTGYTWLERQVDGAPWRWALSANRPVVAPPNLLLASAR